MFLGCPFVAWGVTGSGLMSPRTTRMDRHDVREQS